MSTKALEPTEFTLVTVERDNAIIAFNEGTALWRSWLPRNIQKLAGMLINMELAGDVVISGTIAVEDYLQIPTELEYIESFKEKPIMPSGHIFFSKDNRARLATNFTADEFTCKCKNTSCITQIISAGLVSELQKLRNHLGKAVNITSAYRCVAHNSSVGGANGSQHTKGHACDIYVSGMTAKELAIICKQFRFTGIICYKTSGFVHVSVLSTEGFTTQTS